MNAKVYNYGGDWVTTIGDFKKPLLKQVFDVTSNLNIASKPKVLPAEEDIIENVYIRKKQSSDNKSKPKKHKKKREKKCKYVTPPSPVTILRQVDGDMDRNFFKPYTTSCFQYNNLYKGNVVPKYLNGTVASELKRVGKEYWPSRYYSPIPFVPSCNTKHTHNLILLKQETFSKIKAAILPFRSTELNDQSINSLRSIKRSIEKYWKL